jgi:preprotein translocase subunit SecB
MKPAPISPLQLDFWSLEKLVFRKNPAYSHDIEENEDYEILVDFDVRLLGEENEFVIPLIVEVRPVTTRGDNHKLEEIMVELNGFFRVAAGINPWDLIPGNALAMLYGLARGLVQPALSNALTPFAVLPVVNLQEVITKKAEEITKRSKRAKKPRAKKVQE